jgi:hypothetical protein
MVLSVDQQRALENGEPVRTIEPVTSIECVILRADVFDRLKSLIYNDGPLTEEERLAAIRHAGQRAGWDDPELDVYEEYRKKK